MLLAINPRRRLNRGLDCFEGPGMAVLQNHQEAVNRQWRIRFDWPEGAAGPSNVEIVDYH